MTVHELWYSDFMVGYDYCKQLTVGYDNCKQGRNYTGVWEGVTPPSPKGKERNWAHLPRVAPECWYCETGYILRNFLKN